MVNATTWILNSVQALPYLSNPWLGALAIVLTFFILAKAIIFIGAWYMKTIGHRTKSNIDDLLVKYMNTPLVIFFVIFGFKLALLNLNAGQILLRVANSALLVSILFIIMRFVDVFIEGWGQSIAKKTETKLDDILLPLFHKMARVFFVLIAIVLVLHIWKINVTPYLAGLGIGGIVLGLALQDSLKNIFGGISLIADSTYEIGDKIQLESGEIGEVLDIGLRTTKIRTYDNQVIYVPNGYLANSRILNFTHPDTKLRTKVEFGVAYGSDVEKVKKVVLGVVSSLEHVCKDPVPVVQFFEMGDFALKFRVLFWVDHWTKEAEKKHEATEKIYAALGKSKIEIPFPTHTVYLEK